MGAFNMKLKWFPLDQYTRDGNVWPAMTILGLIALTIFVLIVGDFSLATNQEVDIHLFLAASGIPMSAHIAEMSKDDEVQELEQIAYQDQLTGLRNRRGLIEDTKVFFNKPYSNDDRCALMLLDLDRFKFINDTLGHAAGDKMLCELGTRLSLLSSMQVKCYRLGGDEFVIIWDGGPSFVQVDEFCEKLIQGLSHPYQIAQSEIEGGGSVGITWARESDDNIGSLLQRADMALYKAKTVSGSAHRFFCEQMEKETRIKHDFKQALRKMIFTSDFDLEFQPIAYASDLAFSMFDVSAKSRNPEFGDFSDNQYTQILKETGLIVQFDRAILECTMKTMATWTQRKTVVLQLDSDQLLDPTFPSYFADLLKEHKLSGHDFVFSFDTLHRTDNAKLLENSLDEIIRLGVRIASQGFSGDITNFGLGKKLKNTYLILGKNWVKDIAFDESSYELLVNLVRLADCMNLRVILHGVEHAEQVKCLMEFKRLLVKGDIVGSAKRAI